MEISNLGRSAVHVGVRRVVTLTNDTRLQSRRPRLPSALTRLHCFQLPTQASKPKPCLWFYRYLY